MWNWAATYKVDGWTVGEGGTANQVMITMPQNTCTSFSFTANLREKSYNELIYTVYECYEWNRSDEINDVGKNDDKVGELKYLIFH